MRSTRCSSSLEKVACGAFCAYPSLVGTLWVDLRSTKRAPARLSDISFVSAGKKRGFCQLRSRGKRKSDRFLGSLEKVACGAFCAYPSLVGTLWVDLRSTKRAP